MPIIKHYKGLCPHEMSELCELYLTGQQNLYPPKFLKDMKIRYNTYYIDQKRNFYTPTSLGQKFRRGFNVVAKFISSQSSRMRRDESKASTSLPLSSKI